MGMRQFCGDNVTMLSGHKVVCNCHFTIFIVATPSRHWSLTIFFIFFLVPEALLRCRIVELSRCCCCEAKKFSRVQLWLSQVPAPNPVFGRIFFQTFEERRPYYFTIWQSSRRGRDPWRARPWQLWPGGAPDNPPPSWKLSVERVESTVSSGLNIRYKRYRGQRGCLCTTTLGTYILSHRAVSFIDLSRLEVFSGNLKLSIANSKVSRFCKFTTEQAPSFDKTLSFN